MEKLQLAERDYEKLKSSIMNTDGNDTDDTSPTYKVLEEGANTLSKEETTRLAARQLKFIQNLRAALVRIETRLTVFAVRPENLFRRKDCVLFLMLH